MIKLTDILDELYSNPICPRKEGESDEEYKQRCAPLMGTSVLMNLGSVGEALTPMQKLARKRAMAGKQRMIQRKRQRTALRKKGYKQLYKKAYKAAYRDVYEFFRMKLFPNVAKGDLSVIQKKLIEKWVAKKKRKVIKRAKFKYLPIFREKEIAKFKKEGVDESGKDKSETNYLTTFMRCIFTITITISTLISIVLI